MRKGIGTLKLKRKKKSPIERFKAMGKWQKTLYIAVAVLLLDVVFISGYMIIKTAKGYQEGQDAYTAIAVDAVEQPKAESDSPYLAIDHQKLNDLNGDYIGWLDIPDTKLSYPMVISADNADYLRTSFTKDYLYSGVVFMDFHCKADFSSRNSIIYAHNMKDGSMFSVIESYKREEFWNEHQEIYLYLPDGTIELNSNKLSEP